MSATTALILRTQTDERLAALAASGSERAFVTLVERHRRLLFATALRVVPAADADDVVQQALVSAWSALAAGTEVRHARAWMVQILRHAATRHLARRVEAEDVDARALAAAEDAYASFQTRATLRETLANVARLPDQQRAALLQTVAGGVSQQEIARQLGTSEGGVRQLVHRARQSLRAAATAVMPWPLLVRLADLPAGPGVAGGAGAGLVTKLAVGIVAAGTVSGAGVVVRQRAQEHPAPAAAAAPRPAATPSPAGAPAQTGPATVRAVARPARRATARGRRPGDTGAAPAIRPNRERVVAITGPPASSRKPRASAPGAAPAPNAPVRRPTARPHDDADDPAPTTPSQPPSADDGQDASEHESSATTAPSDDGAETADTLDAGGDGGSVATAEHEADSAVDETTTEPLTDDDR